jgi:hypothetical protein
MTTSPPPAKRSDEADCIQFRLAQEEGSAYAKSLEHMVKEVAHAGDTKRCGDFIISFATKRPKDQLNGRRYANPADVSFDTVQVKTGRG